MALAGVGLTLLAAAPGHDRLAIAVDPAQLRANLVRTLVWSASALVSVLALLRLPFGP